MMALPAWIAAHKGDSTRATFWLVKVDLSTSLYLTNCDQPIVFDGHTFIPHKLVVDGLQSDGASTSASGGRLQLATGGATWTALIGAIATGARAFSVTFWEVWIDPSALPSVVVGSTSWRLVATTKCEAAEWGAEVLTLTLGPSADPALSRLPFRDYSVDCTYRKFKGAQCGYAGADTTCARTYAACTAKANTGRFGGFTSINTSDSATAEWQWEDGQQNAYTGSVDFSLREK